MSIPGPRPKRATIRDVAQLAGVGTMTVSRVASGRGYVSPKMRQRVEAAIAELGYVPNQQARGLRSSRTGTLGLIVSDITNPYFTTLARGVEDAARPHGSLLLLASSDEREADEVRCMTLLVEKGVDGVILVPSHAGTRALEIARTQGIPCLVVDRRGPHDVDCVRCDSQTGAGELAQHLLHHGHRDAVILAAEDGVSTSDDRVAGFLAAFRGSGRGVGVLRGDMTIEAGEALAQTALREFDDATCLFAVNNFLAIGALRALQARGLGVPADMSVVGFDDLPSSMLAFPFLTVMHQPAREMGVLAGERLLARIGEPDLPPEEKLLPTTLVERSSVGPPKR